jgi:hypothetical protein
LPNARADRGDRAHDGHFCPTAAVRMQRVQIGLPHDEQAIRVSTSGWFTQVRTISVTRPA